MDIIWSASNKQITPLIKAESFGEKDIFRIPIIKIAGNEEILNDKIDDFVNAVASQLIRIYHGKPENSFNRKTMRHEVTIEDVIGIVTATSVVDDVLWAEVTSIGKHNVLKTLMNSQCWLDIAVPYVLTCSRENNKIIRWANLIFIDIAPQSEVNKVTK